MKPPVIKGLRLSSMADFSMARAYAETSWRILLDTPTSKWGGTGETHDWDLARSVARHMPVLLAGGVTPWKVAGGNEKGCPCGGDVSSGVETKQNKEDAKIRAVRQR